MINSTIGFINKHGEDVMHGVICSGVIYMIGRAIYGLLGL
jgi:hypothetical protein